MLGDNGKKAGDISSFAVPPNAADARGIARVDLRDIGHEGSAFADLGAYELLNPGVTIIAWRGLRPCTKVKIDSVSPFPASIYEAGI